MPMKNLFPLLMALGASGPTPSPPPNASPTVRGMMSTDPTQRLSGKTFVDKVTVNADAGGAYYSTGVVANNLGACPADGSGAIQWVLAAGWYGCQADGGWAPLLYGTVPLPDGGAAFNFSFAPVDGTGMGAACACAGVTSADGHPLLFDGGAAYCTKHNEYTGIQPGDMVFCGVDQPRIMPGGDGGGGLGISVWKQGVNGLTHTQAFDDAAWNAGGTPTAPTVYANACVSPDGTMDAELVHWPTGTSYLYEISCAINYDVRTVYARAALADGGFGDGGVQATLTMYPGSGSATPGAATWTFNSSGYTRVEEWDRGNTDIGGYFLFGDFGAGDEYTCLWQADCQDNTDLSPMPFPPPIPTTTAAMTRLQDVPLFSPLLIPMRSNYQQTAHLVSENGYGNTYSALIDANNGDGVSGNRMVRQVSVLDCNTESGAVNTDAFSSGMTSSGDDSLTCSYDGVSTLVSCVNATGCGDAGLPFDGGADAVEPVATATLGIGLEWNGFNYEYYANGVIKQLSITEQSTKSIYLFGDSIVEGHTAGFGHEPQYVIHAVKGNAVAIHNGGISGNTVPQCADVFTNQLNIVKDAGTQARSYFMLQCGINSQYDDGGTSGGAANVVTQLEVLLAAAQDAGVHIIGSTLIPDYAGDPFVQAVNVPLRAFGAARGIPIAETFKAMEYPPDSGMLNTAYDFGDNVHPNDAGVFVESTVWMAAGQW